MTRGQTFIIAGAVGLGVLAVIMLRPKRELANPQMDPDLGRHRGLPTQMRPDSTGLRVASAQDPHPEMDFDGYPYKGTRPSSYAQGHWRGMVPGWPLGYSPIDYGPVPIRIPKLWKDNTRYWDGVMQHGATQQNYRIVLFHLRPSMPTRGYRSISGAMAGGGPTASRARVPAVFVPSVIA